jgi:hypothetical protein
MPHILGMRNFVAPRRDFQGLEHRRRRAARLFAAGKLILAAIARELKVSRQSVSRCYEQWKRGGTKALQEAARAGRALGVPALYFGFAALFTPLFFRKERSTLTGYVQVLFSRVNA